MELLSVMAVGAGDAAALAKCLALIKMSACRLSVRGLWTYKFDHRRFAFKDFPAIESEDCHSQMLWPEFEILAQARSIQA